MFKPINLFNRRQRVMLSRSDKKDYGVFMEAISESTEINLDRQNKVKNSITYAASKGVVTNNDIYLYGEINLDNKKDIKYLKKFSSAILNPYDISNFIYSNFNYDTGDVFADDNGIYKGYQIMNEPIKWFKFNYCILGKPKRIIIYKYPIRKYGLV